MSVLMLIYIISFIPAVLFASILWSDICKKKQFGKRPVYFLTSIILIASIGIIATLAGVFPSFFTPESSYAQCTFYIVLYILTFFFAEYSVHSQRLIRSFFIDDFRSRLKRFVVFLASLAFLSLLSILVFLFRDFFTGGIVKASTFFSAEQINTFGQAHQLAGEDFIFLTTIIFILFSMLGFIFLVTIYRTVFVFQAGVIRENTLFLTSSLLVFVFFFVSFIVTGFSSPVAPLWVFIILNLAYLSRIINEYFFQRTRNLDRILSKQEMALQLKNDLINNVVSSPLEEDAGIIRTTVIAEIERARSLLIVREHGISGTIVYTREGNMLKVSSPEHINGFCVPIARLDTLRLLKNREQFSEMILRTQLDIYQIIATPKELLSSWAEKLVKDILTTKKELVVEVLPDELRGLQRLVALYPVFDKDNLLGLLVVFKESFNKFFPEEENALSALVENLKVIFSIIQGKHIQRERNRLQGEMEIAKQIQTSIVPKKITMEGYECAATMITATEVGGDVYDFFPSPYGTYLGIGDVSGHGLPAGITALIQLTAFQSAVRTATAFKKALKPSELYELVNKILCEINRNRIGSDKFMTQNYFLEKDGVFSFAGTHVIALCYRQKENMVIELCELANRTAFMGISEHISAKDSEGKFTLAPHDTLLLYTDGVIEAMDHFSNQFGIQRLKQIFSDNIVKPLEDIIATIMKEVTEHARSGDLKKHKGNFADDTSLLLIRKL